MSSDFDLIDRAFDKARELVGDPDLKDLSFLPIELRHIVRVVTAQGVLDNGGYKYFFESDWSCQPPYNEFTDAYDAITCHDAAADIRRVVATFPFADPHLDAKARNAFMDSRSNDETYEVSGWGEFLCGYKEVWPKLNQYIQSNSGPLGL